MWDGRMKASYQIYSQDAFLSMGISSLLDSIFSMDVLFKDKKVNILLISDTPLLSLVHFFHKLDSEQNYLFIGSSTARNMLRGTGALKFYGFIDISKSVSDIKHELYIILKKVRETNTLPIQFEPIALSSRERLVLGYIASGMTTYSVARKLGLSEKTISSQKRSMMKKLKVTSNQQLLIKSRIANYIR